MKTMKIYEHGLNRPKRKPRFRIIRTGFLKEVKRMYPDKTQEQITRLRKDADRTRAAVLFTVGLIFVLLMTYMLYSNDFIH